jgi:hypothetical protein
MLAVALALIAYCLILVGWFGSNTPGWVVGAVFIPWAMFMAFLGAYWFRVECKAFRLEDDGTCEFERRGGGSCAPTSPRSNPSRNQSTTR